MHVIAHGAPGRVSFAAGDWSAVTLEEAAEDLAAIGQALGARRNLNLWSCQTAAGPAGAAFIAGLARASSADIAAATGRVGAAALAGGWELTAAAQPPLTAPGVAAYAGVLATNTWVGALRNHRLGKRATGPVTFPRALPTIVIPSGGTQPTISATDHDQLSDANTVERSLSLATFTLTLGARGGQRSGLTEQRRRDDRARNGTISVTSATGAITNNGIINISTGALNDTPAASPIPALGAQINLSGSSTWTGTVTNSAAINLTTGATLADTSGIANTGTISGAGTISANINTGGSGTITAKGAAINQTLNLTGTVNTGQTLAINSTFAGTTLEISRNRDNRECDCNDQRQPDAGDQLRRQSDHQRRPRTSPPARLQWSPAATWRCSAQ